jgi:myo-inositol 2-dehydrogenase / D-chiro-inositol 1-dehydrogenase
MPNHTRRKFLKKISLATSGIFGAPMFIPASALGRNGHIPPSDRINLAFIGAGNQAENDVKGFLQDERVQVTAICDVNQQSTGYWNGKTGGREYIRHLVNETYTSQRGKRFKGCRGFEDFREVIDRKDIDAVEVVTPDHWHAIPVLMAAASGKDIYCQKPLALTIAEGRAISNAVRKYSVIFQTGSQQRSNYRFRHICELVRNGRIGQLQTVTCGLPGGVPDFGKTGHLTQTIPVPKNFNYDLWLGPAPEAPYCPARTHVNFRWILDYSGGMVTDWGGHHPDIAQWGMNTEYTGPIQIRNARAKWADHPIWNTATEFYFECVYENGIKLVITNEAEEGVTFTGTEGTVWANRGNYRSDPPHLIESVIREDEIRLYHSDNHYRNFIDCILSREEPAAPAEVAHRSITLAHLGNIAMQLKTDLDWDPAGERFIQNERANASLSRPMRSPWDMIYKEYSV